jgi:gliding motility-associated lipoprotein GldH
MAKRIIRLSVILLPAVLILLSSCNNDIIFADSMPIEGNTWNLSDIATFDVHVDDTVTAGSVIFTIRTGAGYPFRNIYLFVSTSAPDGTSISDTLRYNLADENGNWYGKGLGDINELDLPYKMNVYFPQKGVYRFSIQHGMRTQDLKGVFDFGIRIVKTGKK